MDWFGGFSSATVRDPYEHCSPEEMRYRKRAVKAVAYHMVGLGFEVSRKNAARTSFSLRWPGLHYTIRISDHQMSWLSQKRWQHEMITNCVLTAEQMLHPRRVARECAIRYGDDFDARTAAEPVLSKNQRRRLRERQRKEASRQEQSPQLEAATADAAPEPAMAM